MMYVSSNSNIVFPWIHVKYNKLNDIDYNIYYIYIIYIYISLDEVL